MPATEVRGRQFDVAVIGCGPAGAVAAMQLARAGVRVVAIEKASFPRDKVCGDALIPDALRVLQRIGLFERVRTGGQAASRLLFFSPSGIEVPIATEALVVRREVLDALLAEAAAEAGAVIAQGRVTRIGGGDVASIHVGGGVAIAARIVILATGADVTLLRSLGMLERSIATGVAVRTYVRSSARIEDLIVSFERHIPRGYAWIFPAGGGVFNVGCGVSELRRGHRRDLKAALERFLAESPRARELAGGMTSRTPIAGAQLRAALEGARLVRREPTVIAIGEAIGTTLPLSGEGIGKAMEVGERVASIVARALDDISALDEYPRYIDSLRRLYRGYGVAQRWLERPWLNDLIAALVRGSPYVQRQLEGIMNESVDPRDVFSLRGVFNMLAR